MGETRLHPPFPFTDKVTKHYRRGVGGEGHCQLRPQDRAQRPGYVTTFSVKTGVVGGIRTLKAGDMQDVYNIDVSPKTRWSRE